MATSRSIRKLVEDTPFVDTHEHLVEESFRLEDLDRPADTRRFPPGDISLLLCHYAESDLASAGMPSHESTRFMHPDVSPAEKWALVAPYYERTKNTGYIESARRSARLLYGVEDIRKETVEELSRKIRARIAPRYYYGVLRDVAKIEHAQVNCITRPIFMETQYPDLLCQDLSFVSMSTQPNVKLIGETANREIGSLDDWHAAIDTIFERFGPRAIAVKNQSAYARRLDYADVSAQDAAPLFARFLEKADSLAPGEAKAIQDHLFHYCVRKATDYGLPVKLHTGYFAGHNYMPLERLRQNASDLCPVLQAHPHARFVLMHIDWPYQDEVIALAKHYENVTVDLCWAWIINPAASVRFVKEFLVAAPASKLLTFGGDYLPVELVPGHASIARQGLAQALSELLEEGWLRDDDAPELVERLMRGNAHALFDYEGTLKHWG